MVDGTTHQSIMNGTAANFNNQKHKNKTVKLVRATKGRHHHDSPTRWHPHRRHVQVVDARLNMGIVRPLKPGF